MLLQFWECVYEMKLCWIINYVIWLDMKALYDEYVSLRVWYNKKQHDVINLTTSYEQKITP